MTSKLGVSALAGVAVSIGAAEWIGRAVMAVLVAVLGFLLARETVRLSGREASASLWAQCACCPVRRKLLWRRRPLPLYRCRLLRRNRGMRLGRRRMGVR